MVSISVSFNVSLIKKKIEMFIFNYVMIRHAFNNHYIYNVIFIILLLSNFNGFKKKEILLFLLLIFFFAHTHMKSSYVCVGHNRKSLISFNIPVFFFLFLSHSEILYFSMFLRFHSFYVERKTT